MNGGSATCSHGRLACFVHEASSPPSFWAPHSAEAPYSREQHREPAKKRARQEEEEEEEHTTYRVVCRGQQEHTGLGGAVRRECQRRRDAAEALCPEQCGVEGVSSPVAPMQ